jgi:hypothetical protein
MRPLLLAGIALAALSAGCAMSLPEIPPYPAAPSPADPAPGASFCARTETAARSLSTAQAAGGWVFASLGVASTGGGAIVDLINTQDLRRAAGTSLMLGGIALGAVAYVLFMSSAASARLAEASDSAMLARDDREVWDACVRAKAAWAGAKGTPDAVTREMLAQRERENRRLQDEIQALKKKAGEAAVPSPAAPPPADLPPPLAPRR